MGLNNRGTDTHPENKSERVDVLMDAQTAGAPAAITTGNRSGAAQGKGGVAEDTAPAAPKKKGVFGFKKEVATVPKEGTPEQKALLEQPRWQLSGDLTVRFWTTIMSLLKGGVQFVDTVILKTDKPYDTKHLDFTTSEEQMIADTMPGITTRILQKGGIKSLETAERFINAMVIFRIFGRIFVSLGAHYVDELKTRKEKRAKEVEIAKQKEAIRKMAEASARQPPPAPTPPVVPPHANSVTPAQMEKMNEQNPAEST